MTRVLVVNAGSSTLKLRVLGTGDDVVVDETLASWDGSAPEPTTFTDVAGDGHRIDAVGHRIVHGGHEFASPTLIDDAVASRLNALTDLAPLHQPPALAALIGARAAFPDHPHVACFDTSFHATLEPAARTYAIPAPWRERWGLRRFGFHGLSHAWVARRAPQIAGVDPAARIVSCHLGSGASLGAIRDGRAVDTTMGFTPLEGLVMATRSGSVDPGLVTWLMRHGGLTVDDVEDGLERHGGLAGLSGGSGDMRDVLAARRSGDGAAALAFDVYVHRLRREIAAMAAAMDGVELLAFTGGVGQHVAEVRRAAGDGLGFIGVTVDAAANEAADGDALVSPTGAAVPCVVVEAREDLEIARAVRAVVA